MPRKSKYNIEQIRLMFDERNYKLLSNTLPKSNEYLAYICNYHPTEIKKIRLSDFIRGRGCKDCGIEKRSEACALTYVFVQNEFNKRNYTLLSDIYKNNIQKLQYKCNVHSQYIQSITYADFRAGKGCRYCANERIGQSLRFSFEFVDSVFKERECILVSDTYANNSQYLYYICLNHPDEIKRTTFNSFYNQNKGCQQCWAERNSGENNCNYKADISDEQRLLRRNYPEYREWFKNVFKRDDYTCQICGEHGKTINAHHLYNYADYPDLRLDINNGMTLCKNHHVEFHKIFGNKNNTPEQFEQFKNLIL